MPVHFSRKWNEWLKNIAPRTGIPMLVRDYALTYLFFEFSHFPFRFAFFKVLALVLLLPYSPNTKLYLDPRADSIGLERNNRQPVLCFPDEVVDFFPVHEQLTGPFGIIAFWGVIRLERVDRDTY